MEENLISFKTAKLAKEKGFNKMCYYWYYICNQRKKPYLTCPSITKYIAKNNYLLEQTKNSLDEIFYSAPTQSQLQRWLREKHKIDCLPNQDWDNGNFLGYDCNVYMEDGIINTDTYKSYEQALEAGLWQALNLIKNS